MQITPMDRAVILGASRGLGAALVGEISSSAYAVTGFARKEASLAQLKERFPLFESAVADFSSLQGQDAVIRYILEQDCRKVFCGLRVALTDCFTIKRGRIISGRGR